MHSAVLATRIGLVWFALTASARAGDRPAGVYYWEADRLAAVKTLLEQPRDDQPAELRTAVKRLLKEADAALDRGPYSVTDNDGVPPSGDMHDYVSYSVYWWPDPDDPDGLPFIRRDGRTNHAQRAKGDREALKSMIEDVEVLSLAFYLVERDDYARHARKLLRTWFLDDATKMNPHLQFAQGIPGREDGRGSGIIDSRAFVELLDAIALLDHVGELPPRDKQGLREWFEAYMDWLLTSDHGDDERRAENNHGTWYAAQAARVAMFLDDRQTAKKFVEQARARLAASIADDGSQPEELTRTRSLHYSMFQLAAFAYLARLGESLDVDLWHDDAEDEPHIARALDFALPYVIDQKKWPHEQLDSYALSPQIVQTVRMAQARYDRPLYRRALDEAPRSESNRDWSALLFAPTIAAPAAASAPE